MATGDVLAADRLRVMIPACGNSASHDASHDFATVVVSDPPTLPTAVASRGAVLLDGDPSLPDPYLCAKPGDVGSGPSSPASAGRRDPETPKSCSSGASGALDHVLIAPKFLVPTSNVDGRALAPTLDWSSCSGLGTGLGWSAASQQTMQVRALAAYALERRHAAELVRLAEAADPLSLPSGPVAVASGIDPHGNTIVVDPFGAPGDECGGHSQLDDSTDDAIVVAPFPFGAPAPVRAGGEPHDASFEVSYDEV